jgi:hypothetical protein
MFSIALFAEYCFGYFQMNFKIDFFNLCDECHWDFDGNCV